MILYTTLKQNDLSAVTAEQLFRHFSDQHHGIRRIRRYTKYTITGTFSSAMLFSKISNSHIFHNPNKHVLITDPQSFPLKTAYFCVSRKSPLNLTSKVTAVQKLLEKNDTIESVFESDIWGFDTDSPIDPASFITDALISSPDSIAPFAHPHIHDVTHLSHDDIAHSILQLMAQ